MHTLTLSLFACCCCCLLFACWLVGFMATFLFWHVGQKAVEHSTKRSQTNNFLWCSQLFFPGCGQEQFGSSFGRTGKGKKALQSNRSFPSPISKQALLCLAPLPFPSLPFLPFLSLPFPSLPLPCLFSKQTFSEAVNRQVSYSPWMLFCLFGKNKKKSAVMCLCLLPPHGLTP